MSHPLAKRKKSLVSMIPWIAENLNDHSNLEETLFTEIEGVIPDIRKKAEVFKPEHAAVKMAEAMQPYRNRLGIVLNQQYQTTANALKSIHEQIEKQKTPKKPESEIGQLMQFLKESEIRRQFEGVDKDTRRTILNQTAKAGDRTIIDALENSLAPLVSEPVLSSARAEYEKTAVDRNLVQSYEMNRRILDSLE
ncbi:MAG: hypothetical protein PF482_07975, partial [Desulfobacteraceae bacterium]|nr:hypothetical protein [Desulfobacteraceae bacterium]